MSGFLGLEVLHILCSRLSDCPLKGPSILRLLDSVGRVIVNGLVGDILFHAQCEASIYIYNQTK
jgi:hypothetical protein